MVGSSRQRIIQIATRQPAPRAKPIKHYGTRAKREPTMKLASTMTFLTTVVLAGCETSNTNTQGNAGSNDLRQEVINACTKRADNLWGAAPGTSVANEGQPDRDGNWQLRVSTGNYRSTCTVTPSGYVVGIDPG
jgi:hypothetical protein